MPDEVLDLEAAVRDGVRAALHKSDYWEIWADPEDLEYITRKIARVVLAELRRQFGTIPN